MTATVIIERNVAVPMPDGTVLAADIHRIDDSPRPVLLQRTPYDRGNVIASYVWGLLEPIAALDRGFTVVIQDVRGRWGSGGEFIPFAQEADDGAATIAWLRQQPWCDGHVGMYGMSYVGATQLLAASRKPEGLFAIAPALTAADYYDGWVYEGGVFSQGFVVYWSLVDLIPPDLPRRRLPEPELQRLQRAHSEMLTDPDGALRHPPEVIGELAPWIDQWRSHPHRDEYWDAMSPRACRSDIAVPALHIGGLFDIFLRGTLENYRALRTEAATAYARANQRLILGPWAHGNLADAAGDHHFGVTAALGSLDLNRLLLDFFAAALDGRDVPGPPVRVFVLGADRWLEEECWPPPDTSAVEFGLDAAGLLLAGGRGAGTSGYLHDPRDPMPTRGGRSFLPGLLSSLNAGMKDQRAVMGRRDQVQFCTPRLEESLLVLGDATLSLCITTQGTDLDIVATLLDIGPDGTVYNVGEGTRRAGATGVEVVPGAPVRMQVELPGVAAEFVAGHRVGVRIASASAPRLEVGTNGTGEPAAIAIRHEESLLTLPVRDGRREAVTAE